MRYNKNYAFKDISFLQDGDIIDGCNFSQAVLTDVTANLVFKNMPNMFNCNLTGNNQGDCANMKADLCYWLHPDKGLEEEVPICKHTDPNKVITIETDEGTIQSFEGAREDVPI